MVKMVKSVVGGAKVMYLFCGIKTANYVVKSVVECFGEAKKVRYCGKAATDLAAFSI